MLPVSYRLLDDSIVFRAVPGSRLMTSALNRVVAFEVDALSQNDLGGWSVLVLGYVREIRDEPTLETARQLPLLPWAVDGPHHFLTIPVEHVSGRSFGDGDGQAPYG